MCKEACSMWMIYNEPQFRTLLPAFWWLIKHPLSQNWTIPTQSWPWHRWKITALEPDVLFRSCVDGQRYERNMFGRQRIECVLVFALQTLLLSIPSFHTKRGDVLICYQELELSLIAQNCLAPGSATLLTNLMHLPSERPKMPGKDSVEDLYARGCRFMIYLEGFSPHFHGLTFTETVMWVLSEAVQNEYVPPFTY